MTDGFTQMLDEANLFFIGLAANNRKDWYEPRKEHYASAIRKPAEMMASILAEDLSRMTGVGHLPKVFRIHRDVRFSKDKTPYNAHLHILWSQSGKKEAGLAPAFFFGAEPGKLVVGMGIMGLKGEALIRYRAMVDGWGEALTDVLTGTGARLSDWGDPALKRVPPPYPQDHPHGDLLKRKNLIVMADLGDDWRKDGTGLAKAVRKGFERFVPLHRFLAERLGAA